MFDEFRQIQKQSIENEVIVCYHLQVLYFDNPAPKDFFHLITSQCPLLSDIKLDGDVPEEEIIAIINQCQALYSINIYIYSDNMYSYLRYSKNLVNVTLNLMEFPKIAILELFLIELPLLQCLYISEWLEQYCEDNFEDLVSNDGWTEAQVNHLQRCMKPHHNGYNYICLDMRALCNNCWMNDMELVIESELNIEQ